MNCLVSFKRNCNAVDLNVNYVKQEKKIGYEKCNITIYN